MRNLDSSDKKAEKAICGKPEQYVFGARKTVEDG